MEFTRPKRQRQLARAMWDLPEFLGPLPPHLENGYDASPKGDSVTPKAPTVRGPDVDILTSSVAALQLTTNTTTDQPGDSTPTTPTNLNDLIGKGFSIESFTALLQDPEIFKLESHFKWILELAGPDGRLDANQIAILKGKMLAWVAESDQHLSVFQTVAQKLLLATYSGLLDGDNDDVDRYFADAKETISKAREDPDANDTTSVEQIRVYRYIKLCDELLISQCANLLEDNGSDLTIESIRATVAKCDMNNLQVFCDNASKATLFGMKGHLANQLGLSAQTIEFFRQAVALNPGCYDWQHHLCTSLRRHRRESDFRAAPSADERDVCELANRLRPDYWVSLVALANLYQDINKAKNPKVSDQQRRSNVTRIIKALTKACELAPTNVSANIKLAEAYSEMRDLSPEDIKNCKSLFEYCEEKWPNNSQVFHKIGKFYLKKDETIAENYFATALKVDSTNFPCLQDYLRVKFLHLSDQASVELVDQFIPAYKYKKIFRGKLCVLKGYIQWKMNEKRDAVKSWVSGYENLSGTDQETLDNYYQKTLSGFNDHFFSFDSGKCVIDFNEVRRILNGLNLTEIEDFVTDAKTRIDRFLAFLDANQANNSWRTTNKYRNVSTSDSVGIRAVDDDWRSQHGNGNMNRENRREYQNGLNGQKRCDAGDFGGDKIWRRRTTTDPTSGQCLPPPPFNDRNQGRTNRPTSRYTTNGEPETDKSAAAEDANWRRRDETQFRQEAVRREVVYKNDLNFQITTFNNNCRTENQEQSPAYVGHDDGLGKLVKNKDYSSSRNGIPLDNHGRWKKADLEEEPQFTRANRSNGPKR